MAVLRILALALKQVRGIGIGAKSIRTSMKVDIARIRGVYGVWT